MADRRRINSPEGQTSPPVYQEPPPLSQRQRAPNITRPIYLRTGVTPSASGSAYLEVHSIDEPGVSSIKLTCTIHGPRSLPRSAPFSPHMVLSTHVKYAPFATRQRRGYLCDSSEKDLSLHLGTALRGAIIADRWPKSGVDVVVTVLESESISHNTTRPHLDGWDIMNVLSACITVASAAITDAGIDSVDIVSGGVAALIESENHGSACIVLDPSPREHQVIIAACCVSLLARRHEITNIWFRSQFPLLDTNFHRRLVSQAVLASRGTNELILASINKTMDDR